MRILQYSQGIFYICRESMYLKMYLAGNEKKVWDEIEGLSLSTLKGSQAEDVANVCNETMRRVKENISRILNALKSIEYDLGKFPDGAEHFFIKGLEDPSSDTEAKIKHLESIAGEAPLSLKAFWKTVGSVSLVGCKEGWPEYADPLFVASIDDNIEVIDEWDAFRKECDDHANDPFMLFISPDEDQKDNCEGSQFYNILLPCKTVDGMINDAPSETTFIDYLREAFEAKGFPGLEEIPKELKDLELLRI